MEDCLSHMVWLFVEGFFWGGVGGESNKSHLGSLEIPVEVCLLSLRILQLRLHVAQLDLKVVHTTPQLSLAFLTAGSGVLFRLRSPLVCLLRLLLRCFLRSACCDEDGGRESPLSVGSQGGR